MPTILCIDDNLSGLATRKLLLESQGYSVLTAPDGMTGLALLRTRYEIDAIVLDSRMRGMDGEAVANVIRKEWPEIPIVVLTGLPEPPAVLVALADAVITKGEHPQVLLAALEQLTGTKPKKPPAKISPTVEEARELRKQAQYLRERRRREAS